MDNSEMLEKPFRLIRLFAATGLLSIALLSAMGAAILSHLLTERMLRQEAVLTMEFIHSLVLADNAAGYFSAAQAGAPYIADTFNHIGRMPDVIRASVHSLDRRVIWSSDKAIVGRVFRDNPELEGALAGELVVHDDFEDHHDSSKSEHASLDKNVGYFVEIYFPVRDNAGRIVGAVELYKSPHALFEAIQSGNRAIWTGAVLGGFFLYVTLFWLVRRADRLIQEQQVQLVQSETLAAVGEMGSAVAHGIRNPLASIRSSAELSLETADSTGREAANDIIAEVDRLEGWVRELLSYARPVEHNGRPVDVAALMHEQLAGFQREAERRHIAFSADVAADVGSALADPPLLGQVIGSLIANAFEAMQQHRQGSRVVLGAVRKDKRVFICVEDDGPGMMPEQLARVFKPFYTTKPKGLGVGLPLAKRIVERFGGEIAVFSLPGQGTRVELSLRAADQEKPQ